MRTKAVRADEHVHRRVAKRRHPIATKFFRIVTSFGSLIFGGVLASALYKTGEKKTSRQLIAGLVASKGLVYLLKTRFGRKRPEDILVDTMTPSFPSGHTAAAFTAASILGNRFGSKRFFRSIAGLTGLSRVYLGAHYPSDIIVGSGIGSTIGDLVSYRSKQS